MLFVPTAEEVMQGSSKLIHRTFSTFSWLGDHVALPPVDVRAQFVILPLTKVDFLPTLLDIFQTLSLFLF